MEIKDEPDGRMAAGSTVITIVRAQNWEAVHDGRADGKTEFQLIGWALTSTGSPATYAVQGMFINPDTGRVDLSEAAEGFQYYRMSRQI